MKIFLFFVAIALCPSAHACKMQMDFSTSKSNIQSLLEAAEKTGPHAGFFISRIEYRAEKYVELRRGEKECKRLVFSSEQLMCTVNFKFQKEEDCSGS